MAKISRIPNPDDFVIQSPCSLRSLWLNQPYRAPRPHFSALIAPTLPMPASAPLLFCCTAAGHWHRVLAQATAGVTIAPHRMEFHAVWNSPHPLPGPLPADARLVAWPDLDIPLPHRGTRCWGYALTYPEHRDETLHNPAFRFLKEGSVGGNCEPIPFREFLDFELEIGVLLHREHPDLFGYFLANDLTDRRLQVDHYDPADPGPGFTVAKRFPGSLRAGPLLALGDATLWPRLTATLSLNGEPRQSLDAAHCHLDPARIHHDLFQEHHESPWLLAATGTTGGTLFRTPRTTERLTALVAGAFHLARARRAWLRRLRFLRPGDRLTLHSPILGRGEAVVE